MHRTLILLIITIWVIKIRSDALPSLVKDIYQSSTKDEPTRATPTHTHEDHHINPDQFDRNPNMQQTPPPLSTDNENRECANSSVLLEDMLNRTRKGGVYNKHRVPETEVGFGTRVVVEFWIQEITTVSESTNDFTMDIYINENWLDPALSYEHMNPCKGNLSLSHQVLKSLWTPNSCFINSKVASIHDSPFTNIFLMIYPNGTVWVNYRVKIKGPCDMDLTKFPMDRQQCNLIYESFNYNNMEVQMRWNPNIRDPIVLLKNITLPDFDLEKTIAINKSEVYPAGYWDELHLKLIFNRRVTWYFMQAYLPTYLTIFISWISFCLGHKAMPPRTMLGVSSLLAMIFQFANIMRNLPRVSYVKAIDVWMLACMSFIFASLLELAVIGYMTRERVTPENAKQKAKREAAEKAKELKSAVEAAVSAAASKLNSRQPSITSVVKHQQHEQHQRDDLPPPPPPLVIGGGAMGHHKVKTSKCEQPGALLGLGGHQYQLKPVSTHNNEQQQHNNDVSRPGVLDLAEYVRQKDKSWWQQLQEILTPTPIKVDRAAGVVFPTMFALFNIVYWTYYLNKPDQDGLA